MNPLTQIKNTQKATQREIAAGFSESASWHAKFKHSAYVFAGGLTYTLTEGDLLAVFAQYGEIVDVNLVRCSTFLCALWCVQVACLKLDCNYCFQLKLAQAVIRLKQLADGSLQVVLKLPSLKIETAPV